MRAVELLRELVAVPSPSGEEAEAAALLVRRLREAGFRAETDGAGNAVGRLGRGPRRIVLLGHLDTFPGGPSPREEDGVLHGRGTVDAKGPLAVLAAAAAAVGPVEGRELVVVGAVEEETPGSRGARHVAAGPAPEACIVGEPSGWDGITLGYKGILRADYRWSQPTAHGAGPEPSAAERAVGFWNRVRELADGFDAGGGDGPGDASAGGRGEGAGGGPGEAGGGGPGGDGGHFRRLQARLDGIRTRREGDRDVVSARMEFRLPPGLPPDRLRRELATLEEDGADLRFRGAAPAHRSPRGCAPARALLAGVRGEGGEPRFKVKTGTCDMNVVGPAWGCPVVAYGPGDARLDHTPDERVRLEEVRRAERVLRTALGRLTGADGASGRESPCSS